MDVKTSDGDPAVGGNLARDALFLTKEGTPTPGVALTPERAEMLADELLKAAKRIENKRGTPAHHRGSSF